MGLKKIVINLILRFVNVFVRFYSIKSNQVAFVSLESNRLESDLKLIYDELNKDGNYTLKTVLINYNKKVYLIIFYICLIVLNKFILLIPQK